MDDFDWSDLADKGPQRRHVVIIRELSDEDLQCGHIEKGDTVLSPVFLDREDVFRLVGLLATFESAFSHHVANVATDALPCLSSHL